MSNDIVSGLMMGHLIGSDGGRAERAADIARAKASDARFNRETVDMLHSWRKRATAFSANNEARKMSEESLIAALAAENADHPLATREGFEKVVDENLAKESEKRSADYPAYCDMVEKKIPNP